MSRSDSDQDSYADGDELLTGLCSDCGAELVMRADDPTEWCSRCGDRRARWADTLEARMDAARDAMKVAKATLRPRRNKASA